MDFYFFCFILFHLSRPTTYQKESRNLLLMPITILNGVRHICALPFKFTVATPDAQEATTFGDTEIKALEIIEAPEGTFL